jgi:hypothetical protein
VKQVRACRPLGDIEQPSDLAVTEALDIVEHDHGTLAIGEQGERVYEAGTQIRCFRGIRGDGRQILRQGVGFAHSSSTREIEGCVGNDAVQPRAEWLARDKPIERAVRVQESFLDGVLGVLVRRDNGPSDAIGTSLMGVHQGAERVTVAALRRRDESAFLGLRQRRRRHRRLRRYVLHDLRAQDATADRT